MASEMPFMQFYPTDYLTDTHHLTTLEHGAYFLLILNYWQRGGKLPDEDRKLAGIVKLEVQDWLMIRPVMQEFFVVMDGYWHHIRIEKEFAKVRAKSIKASHAGKVSAAKRLEMQHLLTVVDSR
jgi:uncharacterized protein YdaU (DUF1376 family)